MSGTVASPRRAKCFFASKLTRLRQRVVGYPLLEYIGEGSQTQPLKLRVEVSSIQRPKGERNQILLASRKIMRACLMDSSSTPHMGQIRSTPIPLLTRLYFTGRALWAALHTSYFQRGRVVTSQSSDQKESGLEVEGWVPADYAWIR